MVFECEWGVARFYYQYYEYNMQLTNFFFWTQFYYGVLWSFFIATNNELSVYRGIAFQMR